MKEALTDDDRAVIRQAAMNGATNQEIVAGCALLRRKSGLRQPCLFIAKDLQTFEREVPFDRREDGEVTMLEYPLPLGSGEATPVKYKEIASGIYEEIAP